MGDSKNIQHPIAISICGIEFNKLLLIKPDLTINDKDLALKVASDILWKEFFNFIRSDIVNCKCFVHNLGSFDGLFLYKVISLHFKPECVKTIIDHHNKFISINLTLDNKNTITFLDSFRIFPVGLKELCEIFRVDGIFLLKALTKIGNCKIIQKEGRLYSLQSKDSNNIILTFIV